MNKPRLEGARQSRTRFADRYNAWLRHHRLSAADSLHRVLSNKLSTLMTFLVIGIALALPVGLNVALDNATQLSAGWDSPSQISLFLRDSVTGEEAAALATELEQRPDISAVQVVTSEDALAEFSALSGFADVLASLEDNPLPNLLLVTPTTGLEGAAVGGLRTKLGERQEVSEAVLDMEWLQRLNSLMELSRRIVMAIGGLLVVGVVLILGNTIRLAIENRREEIVIVKLVGGSNPFVRRPFLYTGLWFGFGGGLVAALLVTLCLWFLRAPVSQLAALYQSDFTLKGLGLMGSLNLLVLGGLLGLAGAWLAVTRHLADIEPR
ncbi:permease-like cell division protein FtsX [Pseudohalioglobus lutimaris]|uniref:Cell division protein FtsX n=1 Tax=Pseudohalioglobus lutimaris TaxID=1737061 RepID=A0A2N5X8Z1_9GAMM|nr:permease-like cell division protein FtsX [Pseudohalioglobus lutimaris]PLW70962.1 cell division protein [Pseudohalioglobus lutimaris]